MADGMEVDGDFIQDFCSTRPWTSFDSLPVDLLQRIAAVIPDPSDPVTQRHASSGLEACMTMYQRVLICRELVFSCGGCHLLLEQARIAIEPMKSVPAECGSFMDGLWLQDKAQATTGL